VQEVAGIAATAGTAAERAEAVLERLRPVIPHEAAFVTLLHPDRREHLPLARHGYSDRICAVLDAPAFMEDIETLGMQRHRAPTRVCDFPGPPEVVRTWAEYLLPAGFCEGIGVGLFTPDGRYLGVVAMHTESPVPPTDAARELLGVLAPLIAHAVDPLRSVSAVAAMVHDAVAGVVVTNAGTALSLPGLHPHALLVKDSGVLKAAADQLAGGSSFGTFLVPDADGYLRVSVMRAPPDPPYHFAAVVTLSPPADLRRLTRRELEVLGLLVEGWPSHAIATGLGITERTVSAHIEHILTKFDGASRTVVAVAALRLGLFVPRLLHGTAPHADPDRSPRRRVGPATIVATAEPPVG
jgi:DNA-binding NarL/FixJ family response regulator